MRHIFNTHEDKNSQYKIRKKYMNELMQNLGVIVKILMAIMFIMGLVKIGYGFYNIKQGENGTMDIVGGAGMAVAPFVINAIYDALGIGGSAVDITALSVICF